MPGRSIAVGLVFVVLIAGCIAPEHETAPTSPAGTKTPGESGIDIVGGSLPVDADVVFERVTELMGADVAPPDTVRVIPRKEVDVNESGGGIARVPAFFETVDVDVDPGEGLNATEAANLENGATSLAIGTVTIFPGENDSTSVHYVLAHEFAHYVQAARGRARQLQRNLSRTTDATAVFASLVEGAAVYTTNAYIDRYIGGNLTNSQLYFDLRERLAPGSYPRYVNARYIQGWRYVAWRVTSPSATGPIYATPPTTSEQVIHRLAPGEEPPKPLSVSVAAGGYGRVATDRLGEAFLRVFLQNGLEPARADRAAAGWGNDTLHTYRPSDGGDPAYAWVLRFDDRANGTEFRRAVKESLSARGNRTDGIWTLDESWAHVDVREVSPQTTVLLIGNETFVRNTTVGGTGRAVRLDLPGA